MARNLVKEKDDAESIKAEVVKPATETKQEIKQEGEIKVITIEALILNHLENLNAKIDVLGKNMYEAFKQVGVKFE